MSLLKRIAKLEQSSPRAYSWRLRDGKIVRFCGDALDVFLDALNDDGETVALAREAKSASDGGRMHEMIAALEDDDARKGPSRKRVSKNA